MGRQDLINRLHVARRNLEAAVEGIDPKQEIYAGWTIKHLLAHVAGWDDAVIASLRAHMGGQEPGTPATEGIDVYNAQSVATREPLDLEQVRREYNLSRKTLIDLIAGMPEDRYNTRLLFPWGPHGTVEQLVHIFAHHEDEHATEIERLVAQNKIAKEAS